MIGQQFGYVELEIVLSAEGEIVADWVVIASARSGACPRISGPHARPKSMYWLPSTSHTRLPLPRSKNSGYGWTLRRSPLETPPAESAGRALESLQGAGSFGANGSIAIGDGGGITASDWMSSSVRNDLDLNQGSI